jgi:hypothetical protein
MRQKGKDMERMQAPQRSGVQAGLKVLILILGLKSVVFGLWAFFWPESFHNNVGLIDSYNAHYLHDVGAFELGLGTALPAALWWSDALFVALVGGTVGNVFHEWSHIIDRDVGGRSGDPWAVGPWRCCVWSRWSGDSRHADGDDASAGVRRHWQRSPGGGRRLVVPIEREAMARSPSTAGRGSSETDRRSRPGSRGSSRCGCCPSQSCARDPGMRVLVSVGPMARAAHDDVPEGAPVPAEPTVWSPPAVASSPAST